jgi:hypothetical protein
MDENRRDKTEWNWGIIKISPRFQSTIHTRTTGWSLQPFAMYTVLLIEEALDSFPKDDPNTFLLDGTGRDIRVVRSLRTLT